MNTHTHFWDRIPVPQEVREAHLSLRELWFREEWLARDRAISQNVIVPGLKDTYTGPEPSNYRVVFEDPAEPEAPAKVLVPAPWWLAMALNGDLLPPIEAYLADAAKVAQWEQDHGTLEGFAWNKVGGASHPYAEPIGPMTEEEAIEYLIQKDIPARVWATDTNRPRFAIVPVEAIPTDRTHRMAWRLNDFERAAA